MAFRAGKGKKMKNTWTQEEIEMFKSGMPDYEIIRKTGRTIRAVDAMKRKIAAEEYELSDWECEPVYLMPGSRLTQEQKITRLHDLMKTMRVRLLEC